MELVKSFFLSLTEIRFRFDKRPTQKESDRKTTNVEERKKEKKRERKIETNKQRKRPERKEKYKRREEIGHLAGKIPKLYRNKEKK